MAIEAAGANQDDVNLSVPPQMTESRGSTDANTIQFAPYLYFGPMKTDASQGSAMQRIVRSLVSGTVRFKVPLVLFWLLVLALAAAFGPQVMTSTSNQFFPPPGSPSDTAMKQMQLFFPVIGKSSGIVVLIHSLTAEKVSTILGGPRSPELLASSTNCSDSFLHLMRLQCRIARHQSWNPSSKQ